VWKATKQIGFGIARSQNGKQRKGYFVAVFYPRGNVSGQFSDNVSPPTPDQMQREHTDTI
jgi:hypothetical protein